MKNKIFSFKLYKEGMKQLRSVALLSLLVSLMFLFITQTVSLDKGYTLYDVISNKTSTIYYEIEPDDMLIPPSVICAFASILLPFTLFSFLNKRNYADFYQSLPYTKSCMFLSYSASMLTWYLINFMTPIIVCIATIKLFLKHYAILYSRDLAYILLAVFVIGFMCQGAILIAKSLTGNTFSNTLVALLILIGPRFLTTIIIDTISVCTFIDVTNPIILVPTTDLIPALNGQYNLIIYYLFNPEYTTDLSPVHIIYSAVLGILYLAIAFVLFKKRPSEAAGNTAVNKYVLSGILISLSVVIGAIATSILVPGLVSSQNIPLAILLYVISFAILIMYPLFSARKLSALKKVFPTLVITAVMDILIILSIYGIMEIHKNYTPNIPDRQIVTFFNANSSNDDRLRIQNNSIVSKYVAKAYNYTAKNISSYSENALVPFYRDHLYCKTIATVNGKEVLLQMLIPEEDFTVFKEELCSSEEYINSIRTLPENIEEDMFSISNMPNYTIFKSNNLNLYDSICEEYNKLSDDVRVSVNTALTSYYSDIFSVNIFTENKYMYFDVTPSNFPKTFENIYDYAKTENEEYYNSFYEELNDNISNLYVSITNLNDGEKEWLESQDALNILKKISKENLNYSAGGNFYRIDIGNSVLINDFYEHSSYPLLICTDEPLF